MTVGGPKSTRSTGWVREAELQVSVDAKGRVGRALIISVKGSPSPLWVVGPNAQLPRAKPVLQLESHESFDHVLASLRAGNAAVTWWEQGGSISRLVVSSSWDPKGQRAGTGMAMGVGVALPIG